MALDRRKLSGNIGVGSYAPTLFTYADTASTKAQVAAADYFLGIYDMLQAGDFITARCSDGSQILSVAASSSTTVTTVVVAATA